MNKTIITSVENKTLADIDTIEELRHLYITQSKYSDLWIQLKYKLRLTIKLKGLLPYPVESKQYRQGLFRLYSNDRFFKHYCIGVYGVELTPFSLTINDTVTILLYDSRKTNETVLRHLIINNVDNLETIKN